MTNWRLPRDGGHGHAAGAVRVDLLPVPAGMTMSSREIADLCGKAHGHVMRDVRNMLEGLGIVEGGYIQNWTDPQNKQTYECFTLDKDLTLTLGLGYNVQGA
jgi:phage regulator Rha-like protein